MVKDTGTVYDIWGRPAENSKQRMSDYFGVVPLSTLNTVTGDWQNRKRRWKLRIFANGYRKSLF